jgi:hypothetical protein
MTEHEYVEHIRRAAVDYTDWLSSAAPDNGQLQRWSDTKLMLSPFTQTALCDAWLNSTHNAKYEPLAAECAFPAPELPETEHDALASILGL